MARIGSSDPARQAWLKAAAVRFRCRGRGHIVAASRTVCCFSVVQVYMHCNFASELCIHTDWLNKLKLVESLSFACNLSRMRRDYLSIQEICNSRCDFEQAGNRIASKCTKPCQSPGGYSSVLCHIIYVRKLARNVSRAGQNSA